MHGLILTAILTTLIALAACSDPAPTPEATETPVPRTVATTSPPTANTPEPTEGISPLTGQDREAVISSLSDAELTCIDQDPERMIATLIGGTGDPPMSVEEMAKLISCLNDDTVNQFFIAAIVPGPGPLSAETTDCVLAGLDVIDPRALMTAGLVEDKPERAAFGSMAAFNVSIACLTDEEWQKATPASGISDLDRAREFRLLMVYEG